jgi:hypothetical protein
MKCSRSGRAIRDGEPYWALARVSALDATVLDNQVLATLCQACGGAEPDVYAFLRDPEPEASAES